MKVHLEVSSVASPRTCSDKSICDAEESTHAFFWNERVNTASNIADIPSRDPSLCGDLGERFQFDLEKLRSDLFDMS